MFSDNKTQGDRPRSKSVSGLRLKKLSLNEMVRLADMEFL